MSTNIGDNGTDETSIKSLEFMSPCSLQVRKAINGYTLCKCLIVLYSLLPMRFNRRSPTFRLPLQERL